MTARRPTAVHRYGPDLSQVADLWLPSNPGPHPVAVVVHGGFWAGDYGRQLMNPVSADLADHGWAAWNLEYRRVGAGGGWPATFADVAAGIDALADRPAGGEHELDLGRVAAVGHSAGGQLALWAAARGGLPPGAPGAAPAVAVAAAVSLAGVLDLVMAADDAVGGSAVPRLMGGWPHQVPDRYTLGSPAARLPLGVPQLLVHGEDDAVVPVRLSRAYAAEAQRRGDDVTLAVVAGTDHMGPVDPRSPSWAIALDWLRSGGCKVADAEP